jgi:hypothetical protein
MATQGCDYADSAAGMAGWYKAGLSQHFGTKAINPSSLGTILIVKIALFAFAVWSTSVALGCDCVPISVKQAKNGAGVVFRGTITGISEGKIFFRVDRVWKGDVGRTFEMPEFTEGAACLGFWPALLQVGHGLLVYAWILPGSKDGAYFTSICTRTQLSQSAGEDFARLGRGKPPH